MDSVTKANEIVKKGPESIAEAMYGGEWGKRHLGNTDPGDGWRFHGRGYIQLTGRDRYMTIGKELDLDLVNNPDLVATNRDVAAKVAVQYWKDWIVRFSHQNDVDKATYDINAGGKGLVERRAAAAEWEQRLEHGYVPGAPEPTPSHTLKQGMHGEDIKHAQEELHDLGYLQADPDGRFGPATKAAVDGFQRDQGLDTDGKIGTTTQRHLDAAVRDKQIADFTSDSGPQLRDFSNPSHPRNAMYCTLKDLLPQGTSEERLAQGTAACYVAGITDPKDLSGVYVGDTSVLFTSNSLLAVPAQMDISQPAPSVQQSSQQIQQYDQQQAQIATQIQTQNAQINQQQGPMR